MAILLAANIVYHGSPLGATVIPNGSLPLTALVSVMTPLLSILAMLPLVVWVNQIEPSGEAAMSWGPGLLGVGNVVTTPVVGSRRPTPCGTNLEVNQICPSVAMVIARGLSPSGTGNDSTAPVAGSSRLTVLSNGAVNQTLPAPSMATSDGWSGGELRECSGGDVVAPEALVVEVGEPDVVAAHGYVPGDGVAVRHVDRRQEGPRGHVEAQQDRVVGRHIENVRRALDDVGQDAELAVGVEFSDAAGRRDPSDLGGADVNSVPSVNQTLPSEPLVMAHG